MYVCTYVLLYPAWAGSDVAEGQGKEINPYLTKLLSNTTLQTVAPYRSSYLYALKQTALYAVPCYRKQYRAYLIHAYRYSLRPCLVPALYKPLRRAL